MARVVPRPRRRGLVALASTASVLGALALGSAQAQTATAAPSANGPGSRGQAFAAAAAEFGVPQTVLESVSYAQTRWEGHAGEHNTDGGYGPMNLVDGTLYSSDQTEGKDGTTGAKAGSAPTSVDTLGQAAALLGVDRDVLRKDTAANIRGGAALLAKKQKALGLPSGTTSDAGQWYATVAAASGSPEESSATEFADAAYGVLTGGMARTTTDGQAVAVSPKAVNPQKGQLTKLGLVKAASNTNVECPRSIHCSWVPAPYVDLGDGDYGNHDIAQRGLTKSAPTLDYIVIHDTEASWDTTLQLVMDPTYVSWHYTVRSSDGLVAQHVPIKDVAYHAGNWYVNTHSIGVEHEGFAAAGATWYSEALYRNSAKLVRYLAQKYDIAMDREHIIGHDQVPGISTSYIPGMHWDPGPYWDWQHYFDLMGAPLDKGRVKWSSDIVRILPGFSGNPQAVTGCVTVGVACETQGTNFVYLRTAPSDDAPLVKDIGLHADGSDSTTEVDDISARATAGVDYAVAAYQGDWTSIWWLGQQAWFNNPVTAPTAIHVTGSYVVPKLDADGVPVPAPVHGVAYPEAATWSAYPDKTPYIGSPLPYVVGSGQRYALVDSTVSTDYYWAKTFAGKPPADHVDIRGNDVYYEVSIGHRIGYVKASDVDVIPVN